MIEIESTQLNSIEQNELEQYEQVIERGLQTFYDVGRALLDIKDKGLYREHGTFDDYCRDRWGLSPTANYYLRQSVGVVKNLQDHEGLVPANLEQTIPLQQLKNPEQQRHAWQTAIDTAPAGKVTAAHVQGVVNEMRGKATQLREEYKKQERESGVELPALFNVSDAALWDVTPSVKEITLKLNDYRLWINKDFAVAVQMGKLSPEARGYVANKLRDIAADFIRKADELENDNG